MPTPEDAPTAVVLEKILPEMIKRAGVSGWTDTILRQIASETGVSPAELAQALPDGVRTLVPVFLNKKVNAVTQHYLSAEIQDMRIRDKVTSGLRVWLEDLTHTFDGSRRALDWCAARPLGPLPLTEYIWQVADAIWTGLGDDSTGFTYISKRTSLSAVATSTLAAWRSGRGDDSVWGPFLDRRIENVMAFETFKRRFQIKMPA